MEDKIGIGRGITGDELERQLQEELGEKNPESLEINETNNEVVESSEIKEENKLEQSLTNQVEVLEKKSNAVEKTYEEIGGEEGVKEVLDKMDVSTKEELSFALEEKLKSLIAKKSEMNNSLFNTADALTPGFMKDGEKLNGADILAGITGFMTGLAGSMASSQGLLGKQLEYFVNNPEGGGSDFTTFWTAIMGAMLVPIALRLGASVPPVVAGTMHGVAQMPARLVNLGKTLVAKFQLRRVKKD